MTRGRKRKLLRMASAMLAGVPATLIPAAMAQAQAQPAADTGALEEVTVTAQKRTENLQNVPLSITAINTAKLEELHVGSFDDYAKFLPTLSYQNGGQGGGPGFERAYMRGVASGGDGNHSGPLPSVGTYLDEQPITTIQGALNVHVYDVARVEALAGPQGTLYGASSQAGTIRIITNKPDPKGFKAGYDLQGSLVNHGSGGYVAEGFVNLPLSPTAAIRLVGWSEHDSGFIDNVRGRLTYPTSQVTIDNAARVKQHYNDGDTYGARAALKVDLTDNWTITPGIMGQSESYNGSYGYAASEDLQITRFNPESSRDHWIQAALTLEGKFSNFDVVYAGAYLKRNDETHSDYADYSYFYDKCCGYGSYVTDNAGRFIDPTQYINGKDGYQQQSHELRFSSSPVEGFRYVAGVFLSRAEHAILQRYVINNLATSLSVTGWPNTWWLTDQLRTDRDYAGFGEVTYDFTPKLSATGGVRFFKSKNSLQGFFGFGLTNDFTSGTGEKGCTGPAVVAGSPCTNVNKTVEETGHTQKLNLTYHIDDDRMIYATYSNGFRPGGLNRVGSLPPYIADYLSNYEIGWKTSWDDKRIRFNGAVFVENWQDFQFAFLGPNSVTQIANAGSAQIKGIEGEVTFAPTRAVTLSSGFAYLDAKLTHSYCGQLGPNGKDLEASQCKHGDGSSAVQAPDGAALPVTPKFKANVVVRYGFNLGSFDAHVQGAAVYVGERWPDLRTVQQQILGREAAYTLADVSAGIDGKNFTLELFVNNLLDKRAQLDRWAQCDASVCGMQGTYITPAQPRTIGIKFGQKF